MKLSTAIKLGSKKVEDIDRVTFYSSSKGEITHACPLGTAYMGLYSKNTSILAPATIVKKMRRKGINLYKVVDHPETHKKDYLWHIIISLVDKFFYRRLSVIRWLEKLGL